MYIGHFYCLCLWLKNSVLEAACAFIIKQKFEFWSKPYPLTKNKGQIALTDTTGYAPHFYMMMDVDPASKTFCFKTKNKRMGSR
jgi:hypothetical protein